MVYGLGLRSHAVAYLAPGVRHDSHQQIEEDDCHHKHVEHHQENSCLRVVAVVEDTEFKAADHKVEHGQPGVPDGAELLQCTHAHDSSQHRKCASGMFCCTLHAIQTGCAVLSCGSKAKHVSARQPILPSGLE